MNRLNPQPPAKIDLKIISDVRCATLEKYPEGEIVKTKRLMARFLQENLWRGVFPVPIPDVKMELDWYRIGARAGYAAWRISRTPVAATLFLNGTDSDDSLALESLSRAVKTTGPSTSAKFFNSVRDCDRPMAGIVYAESDPGWHRQIEQYTIGLSAALCDQIGVNENKPPLGTVLARDFPPRFLHLLVINGTTFRPAWAESKRFRDIPNLRELLATFMHRLEESMASFDERLLLEWQDRTYRFRVQWTSRHPTVGSAQITGDKSSQDLLLLSGKDPKADADALEHLRSTLPHFIRGQFEKVMRGLKTCPRPVVVDMFGVPLEQIQQSAFAVAEALALAFFRRSGVF